jgi:hypothetical protein
MEISSYCLPFVWWCLAWNFICLPVATAAIPKTFACISIQKLQKNMPVWVDKVPYSHVINTTWGYPTDCSGFVSWALETGNDIKAYEYASTSYSSSISIDDLRYGDVVTHVFGDNCEDDNTNQLQKKEKHALNASTHGMPALVPEVSGHVFFFDKWDDDNHNNYWAYESSETQDQTQACLDQTGLLTRSACLNHYVLKPREKLEKWSQDKCISKTYGIITGGPKRLTSDLLCPELQLRY